VKFLVAALSFFLITFSAAAKTITLTIEIPDEIQTQDNTAQFNVVYNQYVEKWLVYFVTKDREYFGKRLEESSKYSGVMKKIFSDYGLPQELIYIAMIESGFNPLAYSPAHAVGTWQFMKGTGKIFGLSSDNWSDERRDVEKSTNAAAKMLKSLYAEFGSWPLAIAAYNCGNPRIKKAIKEQGTRNFFELSLPNETMLFVPKVMAAILIAKDPQAFGFELNPKPALEFDTITVNGCVNLVMIAKCCEVDKEEIVSLNPHLTFQCTPDQKEEYEIKIPVGTKEKFLNNFNNLSDKEKYVSKEEIARMKGGWVVYSVKKGDTLGSIAKKYRTTVQAVLKWNPKARGKYIQPSDKLKIFKSGL